MYGTIYLIQPAILIGTTRYKIGCSKKNNLERLRTYRKGSRFINIQECRDPFAVELELRKQFENQFKLTAGREWFEGNEEEIKKVFNDVVTKFTLKSENGLKVMRKKVCDSCGRERNASAFSKSQWRRCSMNDVLWRCCHDCCRGGSSAAMLYLRSRTQR